MDPVSKIQKGYLEKVCTFTVWLNEDLIGGLLHGFYIGLEKRKCVILISNDFDSIKMLQQNRSWFYLLD